LVEVMVQLGNAPVSFSDGSQTVSKSSIDVLKDVLNAKPVTFRKNPASRAKKTKTRWTLPTVRLSPERPPHIKRNKRKRALKSQ